ncbi:cell wall-binding repeat-containing protein [Kineococcus gynurae]|uniref:Cell wall-binding repeat-containing protein n=1 Tax=Kineococcus gynurae TaxID=452979 RepID=A0ABV5LPT8_9ACTN
MGLTHRSQRRAVSLLLAAALPLAVAPAATASDVRAGAVLLASRPTITSPTPVAVIVLGSWFTHTYTADGDPAPTWSVTSGSLPRGLSLDPVTGVLSGVPQASLLSVSSFTVTARNASGSAGQAALVTTVLSGGGGGSGGGGTGGGGTGGGGTGGGGSGGGGTSTPATAPAITSAPPVGAVVGAPYRHQFSATGSPAPTWTADQLPPGLTLDAGTGLLSGTPVGVGATVFTVTATNPAGSAGQLATLAFVAAASPPRITSAAPPPADVGEPYAFAATASGVPTPTWSVPGGLPAGLRLDPASGVITGTPTAAGSSTVTLVATNSAGSDRVSSTMVVTAPGTPPVVEPRQTLTGTQGVAVNLPLVSSGTPRWSVVAGRLPSGVTLDVANGVVAGVPTSPGSGEATLRATSPAGSSDTVLTWVIDPAPVASAPVGGGVDRYHGPDRVQTSVAVSGRLFRDTGSVRAAVLSTSERYADALAGGRLASAVGGPLLLTPAGGLSPAVAEELRRVLGPGATVYVLGGPGTLSPAVVDQVRALPGAPAVERLAGDDRYATAVAVAEKILRLSGRPTSTTGGTATPVYLVNGQNYPDGLAVSALAARTRGLVLLTADDRLPASTAAFLGAHDPAGSATVPVGGRAVTAAGNLPGAAGRTAVGNGITGADRYDTAQLVAVQFTVPGGAPLGAVGLATGENWPDALVGAAAMGALGSPLLLTPREQLHPRSQAALAALNRSTPIPVGLVFGGPNSVSDSTVDQFRSMVPGVGGAVRR